MKREAFDHPKFKLVGRDLKLSMFAVRGLMVSLWLVTGINFPNGLITWSPEEIAVAIDYPEDAAAMVESLVNRKLLDRIPGTEGLYVHDWHVHADDAVHMKLARNAMRFGNGELPTLTRLTKEQRERALAKYGHHEGPLTQDGDAPQDAHSQDERAHPVRTKKKSERTKAHESALPEPEPEPDNNNSAAKNLGSGGEQQQPDLPPNREAVAAYLAIMAEIPAVEADSAADRFWAKHEAQGWLISGQPMRSWTSAVDAWWRYDLTQRHKTGRAIAALEPAVIVGTTKAERAAMREAMNGRVAA